MIGYQAIVTVRTAVLINFRKYCTPGSAFALKGIGF